LSTIDDVTKYRGTLVLRYFCDVAVSSDNSWSRASPDFCSQWERRNTGRRWLFFKIYCITRGEKSTITEAFIETFYVSGSDFGFFLTESLSVRLGRVRVGDLAQWTIRRWVSMDAVTIRWQRLVLVWVTGSPVRFALAPPWYLINQPGQFSLAIPLGDRRHEQWRWSRPLTSAETSVTARLCLATLSNIIITNAPSNLRREHPRTRAFSHACSLPVTWQDGGHAIRSAVVESHMLPANFVVLCFIERELLPMEYVHRRNRNFRPFWLLWPWHRPDDLCIRTFTRIPWRHTGCANVNVLRQRFRKLSYLGGHFRSHDKDGCYTIRSDVIENPMLHANLMALSFIEPEL